MRGKIYGVGVGPGDPEQMTLKAVRIIKESDVVAVPGENAKETLAYRIASGAVPELAEKGLLGLSMPMSKDRSELQKKWESGAKEIEALLDAGKNVAFLTLGDPTIYSTFSYIQHILEADGYEIEIISGIPSFCAAASRLKLPLAEWDEVLHVVPAMHRISEAMESEGNFILMKSGSHIEEVKEKLREKGLCAMAVENCDIEGERVYGSIDEIPADAGYFLLIVAKSK